MSKREVAKHIGWKSIVLADYYTEEAEEAVVFIYNRFFRCLGS